MQLYSAALRSQHWRRAASEASVHVRAARLFSCLLLLELPSRCGELSSPLRLPVHAKTGEMRDVQLPSVWKQLQQLLNLLPPATFPETDH